MSSREILQCLADSAFLDLQDGWTQRELSHLHASIFDKRRIQADLREGEVPPEEEEDDDDQYSPPHEEVAPSVHTVEEADNDDDDDDGSSVLSFGCG